MRLPETGSGEGRVRDGCLSHVTPCWSAVAEGMSSAFVSGRMTGPFKFLRGGGAVFRFFDMMAYMFKLPYIYIYMCVYIYLYL